MLFCPVLEISCKHYKKEFSYNFNNFNKYSPEMLKLNNDSGSDFKRFKKEKRQVSSEI